MRPKRLTRAQKKIISARGYNAICWHLLQELPNSYILKRRITGEVKVVEK